MSFEQCLMILDTIKISNGGTGQDFLDKLNVRKNIKIQGKCFIIFVNKEYDIQIIRAVYHYQR